MQHQETPGPEPVSNHDRNPALLVRVHVYRLLYVITFSVVLALAILAWLRFAPVTVTRGWQYREVQSNLDRIVALERLPDDSVLATLSAKQHPGAPGRGQLIRLDIPARRYTVLADGLFKPAGLLAHLGGVVLTQEYPQQPVLLWKDGEVQPLFRLANPESIAATADGTWLIIEDTPGGRLLQIDPRDGYAQKVLAEGFAAGEGVCSTEGGRVFVVDAKKPDLFELRDGRMQRIAAPFHKPGFLRCTSDGLWITEDATNNGRLWFYDFRTFHHIASHLHAPQSVLPDGDGVLVAEQGRSRLLRLARQ